MNMSLYSRLQARAEDGNPVRVGVIGCGKFGSMYLTQARLTTGVQIIAIADLNLERARTTLEKCGWPAEQYAATSLDDAVRNGTTYLSDSSEAVIASDAVDIIIEATGDPVIGIRHCLDAIDNGRHVIMVNVEADALAGPVLAKRASAAGVVYSLAWGDQPALICEHVDWARACGFKVVCAGKGTRYLPEYHQLTPDKVWGVLEKYLNIDDRSLINPKMFNSFLDGTKSAIEMTAVCNATGLTPQPDGLNFPPATRFELANICKPAKDGGVISHSGTTEVTSSLYRDGSDVPHHIGVGTYVVIEGETDYARSCFGEYHMLADDSRQYASLYRPIHMIGLELGYSVASIALRNEPTGAPYCFNGDVVAVAKKDLKAGEILDGEGGYCVWGKAWPAKTSVDHGALPIGLAHQVRLKADVAEGAVLKWSDVEVTDNQAISVRRELEAMI